MYTETLSYTKNKECKKDLISDYKSKWGKKNKRKRKKEKYKNESSQKKGIKVYILQFASLYECRSMENAPETIFINFTETR